MSWIRLRYRRFLRAGTGFTCGRGTLLFAQNGIRIGDHVYFGRHCSIECDAVIGNYVLIANNVAFVGRHDHDYQHIGVPVRIAPSVRDPGYMVPKEKREEVIADDVWIGYGAIILSGVNIGEGSIVAAGTLVTRDVGPFSIVAGVPARVLGERFARADQLRHVLECQRQGHGYRDSTAGKNEQ